MNEPKSILIHLGEALDHYRAERRTVAAQQTQSERTRRFRHLLPTPGNVIFTLVMIAVLLWRNRRGPCPSAPRAPPARAPSPTRAVWPIAAAPR